MLILLPVILLRGISWGNTYLWCGLVCVLAASTPIMVLFLSLSALPVPCTLTRGTMGSFEYSLLTQAALVVLAARVGKAPQARNVQSLGSWKPARNFCSPIPRGMRSLQRKTKGDHFFSLNVIDLNRRCFPRVFKIKRAVLEIWLISWCRRRSYHFKLYSPIIQYRKLSFEKRKHQALSLSSFKSLFSPLHVCSLFSEKAGY